MVEKTITELIIDATGAERGSATYVRAMAAAESAARRVVDTQNSVDAAINNGGATMAAASTSIAARTNAWNRLVGSVDPVIRAENSVMDAMKRASIVTENAVKSGIATRENADRIFSALRAKELAGLEAVKQATQLAALTTIKSATALQTVRAEYDQLYAAQLRYAQGLEKISLAEKGNAISADLATAARAKAKAEMNSVRFAIAQDAASAARFAQSSVNSTLGVRDSFGADSRGSDLEAAFGGSNTTRSNILQSNNPRLAAIMEYRNQINQWRQEQKLGVIDADELTSAINRQRRATLETLRVIKQGHPDYQGTSASRLARPSNFNSLNIAAQFQDIGVTAAMGMNPMTIALQQGTQISAVLQSMGGAKSGVAALQAALMSMISPLSLITIGAVAGAAALIQWGMSGVKATEKLSESLKKFRDIQKEVTQGYIDRANAATKIDSDSQNILALRSVEAAKALEKRLKDPATIRDLKGEATFGYGLVGPQGEDNPLTQAVRRLRDETKNAVPDFAKFRQSLLEVANDSSFSKNIHDRAVALLELTKGLQDAQLSLEKFNKESSKGFQIRGEEASMSALNAMNMQNAVSMQRAKDIYDADIGGIGAKSPSQKAAAARAREAANYNGSEPMELRNQRIDLAGKKALIEAEYAISEAQKERLRALDATIASQRMEQGLIGKTAGEVATLRMEHEKLAALKEESFRTGVSASEVEIAAIKEAAKQTGILADATARLTLQKNIQFEMEQTARTANQRDTASQLRAAGLAVDLSGPDARSIDNNRDMRARVDMSRELRFEQEQMMRTANDQAVATRLRSAGLEVDLNSFEARQIKFNQWLGELQSTTSTFLGDFKNGFISNLQNGDDFGKALSKALGNAVLNAFNKAAENGIDLLSKMISSAIGGAFGFRGGGEGGAASSLASGFIGNTTLDALVGSNDNISGSARSNIVDLATRTRMPASLAAAGVTKTGIPLAKISAQGLTAKVNAQYADRFQGLLDDLTAQGYDISSLGEGGYSYRNVKGSSKLSNHAFGNAIDINPRQNPWSKNFKTDLPSNVNELAQKNGLFWGGNWNKPDTMHFQVDKSVKSLERLSSSTARAAQSVTGFGGGLGSLGKSLMSIGGGSGGTGWFSKLMGMFGGAGGAMSFMNGISPGITSVIAAGGGGLFAEGTPYAPGGRSVVNERGGEIIDLPRGSRVIPHDVSMQMAARAGNAGASGSINKVEMHVHVNGASGDDHIKNLARQGAHEALSRYDERQRQGGMAQANKKYASLKG